MAKSKKATSLDIAAMIKKDYGEGVMVDLDTILERHKQVIPVSPALDLGLSGGIPEGSWVLVSGPPKSGKTTTALHFAANCQKEEFGGRDVYLLDAEGRFTSFNALGIKALNRDKLFIINSTPDKILTGEDFLTIATHLIHNCPKCVIILDSSSALSTANREGEEVSGQTRKSVPKLLSDFCSRMGTVVPVKDVIMIVIQHLITNTSGHGKKFYEDGGVKIQYQADVKIRVKWFEWWMLGEDKIGQKVHWGVVTSAVGPPGADVEGFIKYGEGIDEIEEIVILACDIGLIDKAGSWYDMVFLEEPPAKMQGQYKVSDHLKNNPEDFALLKNLVRDALV